MKRMKLVGAGMLTVLAMMLAVLPASGASATKLLKLEVGGKAVANGSPGDTGIGVEECSMFSNGTVGTNDAAKVVLTETTTSEIECESGTSISGIIKQTLLTSGGKATLKGPITVHVPGPCIYKFGSFKGTFSIPGFAVIEGTGVGARVKKGSSLSCAEKTTQSFFATVSNLVLGEPFQTAFG